MALIAGFETRAGDFRVRAQLREDPGAVTAIAGPNGAGKTTLLRALAGLLAIDSGEIALDGVTLDDGRRRLPPERRPVGLMSQHLLLFPHLSARDNVAFGLRARGATRKQARIEAGEWLERFGLSARAGARPNELSGGQAQRVALARALAPEPRLLLLDEPFAALDAVARREFRSDLLAHLRGFDGVCLLVTHDPIEALSTADRLVVMEEGAVVQSGTPERLRAHPASRYVAEFLGVNVLRGEAAGGAISLTRGEAIIPATAPDRGGRWCAVVHPAAVALHRSRPEGSPRNVWESSVISIEHSPDRLRVALSRPEGLVAEITPRAGDELGLVPGVPVYVSVKATEVDAFPL